MAVTENNVLMRYKDSAGNTSLLYPITKADNVDGLDNAIRNQGVVTYQGPSPLYPYMATVEGINELSIGASFVMIPHRDSIKTTELLNVNNLGMTYIRRRVSSSPGTTTAGATDDWLVANIPIRVTYDGTFWIADLPRPNATDLMGTVGIQNGGTGATTAEAARTNLGIDDVLASLKTEIDAKHFTRTATISTSWTGDAAPYTQTVSVEGLLATDLPHITPVYSDTLADAIAQKEAWCMVSEADAGKSSIAFTCFEDKPTVAIPIQIEVIR